MSPNLNDVKGPQINIHPQVLEWLDPLARTESSPSSKNARGVPLHGSRSPVAGRRSLVAGRRVRDTGGLTGYKGANRPGRSFARLASFGLDGWQMSRNPLSILP